MHKIIRMWLERLDESVFIRFSLCAYCPNTLNLGHLRDDSAACCPIMQISLNRHGCRGQEKTVGDFLINSLFSPAATC